MTAIAPAARERSLYLLPGLRPAQPPPPPPARAMSLTSIPSPYSEFETSLDTLGRLWNPLLHPRDRNGRFIRTFSRVSYRPKKRSRRAPTFRGDVLGFDRDTGDVRIKVTQVDEDYKEYGLKVGDIVQVPQGDLETRLIKARFDDRTMTDGPSTQVQTVIRNLRKLGYGSEADRVQAAFDLAQTNKAGSNQSAIETFRKVAEEIDLKKASIAGLPRRKGTLINVDDIADPHVRGQIQALDNMVQSLATARHNLGDKVLPFEMDRGQATGNESGRRLGVAKAQMDEQFADHKTYVDFRTGTTKQVEETVATEPRDQVYEREGENVLPALLPSLAQKVRQGITRAAAIRRTAMVAPGDRYHLDKQGDAVFAGSVVDVAAGKEGGSVRPAARMIARRIHTEKSGKKLVYVRHFDPGYAEGYHDYRVTSKNMELASIDDQSQALQNLAVNGEIAKDLLTSFSPQFIMAMRARYATKDAKGISRLGGNFFDTLPIDERVRADKYNSEVRHGDWVSMPNGELGIVSWISGSKNNMLRVQTPDGQPIATLSPRNVVKMHATDAPGGDYVPTREEAAAAARRLGAEQVAKEIENPNSDHSTIKDAMAADPAFQEALKATPELYASRDRALAAGRDPDDATKARIAEFNKMAAASAGEFRIPTKAQIAPPTPPTGENVTKPPTRAINQGETIGEDGTRTDTETKAQIPGGTTEPPAPAGEIPAPSEFNGYGISALFYNDLHKAVHALPEGPAREAALNHLREFGAAMHGRDMAAFRAALDGMLSEKTGLYSPEHLQAMRGTDLQRHLSTRKYTKSVPETDPLAVKVSWPEYFKDLAENHSGLFFKPVSEGATTARPPTGTDEGIPISVDITDDEISQSLLDGLPVFFNNQNETVTEGYAVQQKDTSAAFPTTPTVEDIKGYLADHPFDDEDHLAVHVDPNDGGYRISKFSIFPAGDDGRAAANALAESSEVNQFIDISTGEVLNVSGPDTRAGDEPSPTDKSSERAVQPGDAPGTATVRKRTAKQDQVLNDLLGTDPDDAARAAIQAVLDGTPITAEQAAAINDHVASLPDDALGGVTAQQRSGNKGVAAALADRIARATGSAEPRGYASRNTALRRSSDITSGMYRAMSPEIDDEIADVLQNARDSIKAGDYDAASAAFRQAADALEQSFPDQPQTARAAARAREHADRMDRTEAGKGEGQVIPTATATEAQRVDSIDDLTGTVLLHGGLPPDADIDSIDLDRAGSQQNKRGRSYGGFYLADRDEARSREWAEKYAKDRNGIMHAFELKPDARILDAGDRNTDRLSAEERADMAKEYDVVKGKDSLGRAQYVLLNKGAIARYAVVDLNEPTPGGSDEEAAPIGEGESEGTGEGAPAAPDAETAAKRDAVRDWVVRDIRDEPDPDAFADWYMEKEIHKQKLGMTYWGAYDWYLKETGRGVDEARNKYLKMSHERKNDALSKRGFSFDEIESIKESGSDGRGPDVAMVHALLDNDAGTLMPGGEEAPTPTAPAPTAADLFKDDGWDELPPEHQSALQRTLDEALAEDPDLDLQAFRENILREDEDEDEEEVVPPEGEDPATRAADLFEADGWSELPPEHQDAIVRALTEALAEDPDLDLDAFRRDVLEEDEEEAPEGAPPAEGEPSDILPAPPARGLKGGLKKFAEAKAAEYAIKDAAEKKAAEEKAPEGTDEGSVTTEADIVESGTGDTVTEIIESAHRATTQDPVQEGDDSKETSAQDAAEKALMDAVKQQYPELQATVDSIVQLPEEEYELNEQQKWIVAAALTGKDTIVRALAGTGKTSTLLAIARRMSPGQKGLYMAFNVSVREGAEEKFPDHVEARTINSLAYVSFLRKGRGGKKYLDKLEKGLAGANDVAQYVGISGSLYQRGRVVSDSAAVGVVQKAVKNYMVSADDELSMEHVKPLGLDMKNAFEVLKAAKRMWADYKSPDGQLKYDQDALVKMWALERPDFRDRKSGVKTPLKDTDILFFDEAQDINDVIGRVVRDNIMQTLTVGDSNQAIYGFRGAEDQLQKMRAHYDLQLTKSYRYGNGIGSWGNRGLQLIGSDQRLIGVGNPSSIYKPHSMKDATAVITATNKGALYEALDEMERGRTVGVAAKVRMNLRQVIETVGWLRDGKGKPDDYLIHPDMKKFLYKTVNKKRTTLSPKEAWNEFVAAATDKDRPDPDAQKIYKLTTQFEDKDLKTILDNVRVVTGKSAEIKADKLNQEEINAGSPIAIGDNLQGYIFDDGTKFAIAAPQGDSDATTRNKELFKPMLFGGNRLRWDPDGKRWWVPFAQEDAAAREQLTADLTRLQKLVAPKIDVVITTGHMSKGLEWDRVRIGDDWWQFEPKIDKETGEEIGPPDPEPEARRLAYVALTRAKDALDPGGLAIVEEITIPENGEAVATTHDGNAEMSAAQAALDAAITTEAIGGMDVPEAFDPGSKWDYRPVLNQFINGSHKDEWNALSRAEKRAAARQLVESVQTGGPRHVTNADEFVLLHADGDLKAAAAKWAATDADWGTDEQRYLDADKAVDEGKAPTGEGGDEGGTSTITVPDTDPTPSDLADMENRKDQLPFREEQAADIRKASNTQVARTSKVYGADRRNWPGSLHTVERGEAKADKAEQAVEELKQIIREDDAWLAAAEARKSPGGGGVPIAAPFTPSRGGLEGMAEIGNHYDKNRDIPTEESMNGANAARGINGWVTSGRGQAYFNNWLLNDASPAELRAIFDRVLSDPDFDGTVGDAWDVLAKFHKEGTLPGAPPGGGGGGGGVPPTTPGGGEGGGGAAAEAAAALQRFRESTGPLTDERAKQIVYSDTVESSENYQIRQTFPPTTVDEFAQTAGYAADLFSVLDSASTLDGSAVAAANAGHPLEGWQRALMVQHAHMFLEHLHKASREGSLPESATRPVMAALKEHLDKFNAGAAADLSPVDKEAALAARQRLRATVSSIDTPEKAADAIRAAVQVLDSELREPESADLTDSPAKIAKQMGSLIDTVLTQALKINHGRLHPKVAEALDDSGTLSRGLLGQSTSPRTPSTDMHDYIALQRSGLPEGVKGPPNALIRTVTWSDDSKTFNSDHIKDDRPPLDFYLEGDERDYSPEELERKNAYLVELRQERDAEFDYGLGLLTPNGVFFLNNTFKDVGGVLARTGNNITEGDSPLAKWVQSEIAAGRPGFRPGSSDIRTHADTAGAFLKGVNSVIVADRSLSYTQGAKDAGGGYGHVVTHELGHTMDSMLGEMSGPAGKYFSEIDTDFRSMYNDIARSATQAAGADVGRTMDSSLLNWYYRNESLGQAKQHNSEAGTIEMFAQGYSAYAAALRTAEEMGIDLNSDKSGSAQKLREKVFRRMGSTVLTQDASTPMARWNQARLEVGEHLFKYFDNLEKTVLPAMWAEGPTTVLHTKQGAGPEHAHGAPPAARAPSGRPPANVAAQLKSIKRRDGSILEFTKAPDRGTPEWDAWAAQLKATHPTVALPGPTYVQLVYNQDALTDAKQGVVWRGWQAGKTQSQTAYSEHHKETSLAQKHQRGTLVDKQVPAIIAKAKEGAAKGDPVAIMALMIASTGMRVSSSDNAGTIDRKTGKKIPTYGASSLMKKHVFFPSATMVRFKFIGKANKENTYESRDPELIAAMRGLVEGKTGTQQIFPKTNSTHAINFFREASGIDEILNHDLRTWFATDLARREIAKTPKSHIPKTPEAFKKQRARIAKIVGDAINDGPAVADKNYIAPGVWLDWQISAGVPPDIDEPEDLGGEGGVTADNILLAAVPPDDALDVAVDEEDPTLLPPELFSREAIAERAEWYASFMWPGEPRIAPPVDEDEEAE